MNEQIDTLPTNFTQSHAGQKRVCELFPGVPRSRHNIYTASHEMCAKKYMAATFICADL